MLKSWKLWLGLIVGLPILLFVTVVAIVYIKQDAIVQELITKANEDFRGTIQVEDSHISAFANFPYVSIDLDHAQVFEGKDVTQAPLFDVHDVYLGFDLFTLLKGEVQIKALKLSDGVIKLVQHTDGSFNLVNALATTHEIDDTSEEFHLDIRSIELINIDVFKFNEENNLLIEVFIDEALSKFRSHTELVSVSLDSRFLMNVMMDGDTTFIKHKHFSVQTELEFSQADQQLTIKPSQLRLEQAYFSMGGTVDMDDDMNLDLVFHGSKPNFDLLMAFAPEELMPVLQRYDNAGKIYFDASVKGKSINGHNPLVVADFGCEDAYFNNKISKKRLDQLFFKGHFTTGALGNASTSEFSLTDFSARPEAGSFKGNLLIRNFDSPEIDVKLRSEFELAFLAQFLNLTDLQDLKGSVALTMNFHDIIDLANPEKSIEKLNESYFTELEVENLSFRSPAFDVPINDLDIRATMDGHTAVVDQFNLLVGESDISIQATISDLPAILHHTKDPVTADMIIKAKRLNIKELTSGDSLSKPVDEDITDLSLKLKFKSSARSFTESPNLPVGEFFIEDLYAKLRHYPHTLHDFHADVFVDEQDFRVVDFTGMIDKSDFHFTGRLRNYDLWFLNEPLGDTKVEFNLTSKLLQLEDLFSYEGENYVPADYRHEEFQNLRLHGFADLHFNKGLKSADVTIDRLEAKMKVHPLRFEQFSGRFHYEDEHLMVEKFKGKLGKSEFIADLNYYLGADTSIRKRDNHFELQANRLDFDELFSYTLPTGPTTPADHEAGFNIYEVPFSNMTFNFDIKKLNYHRYQIDNFFAKARTTPSHYLFVDTLHAEAAGGRINMHGYFNGSDPKRIYLSPVLRVENVDLDKLLFKFENFGQDHLVSENLHGQLSGAISGKVHMHADLVPILDDSELHLDVKVVNGRLEQYKALHAVSDYFKDKDLDKVRFDTLQNKLDWVNGKLSIPAMTINSTLGFIELSGKQDLDMNMEYYVRIPWKLVTQVASQKLFGSKDQPNVEEDEIQYRDDDKKQRFVNLKISGTPENYKISLAKDKKK